jgi:hypothetical protein
MLPQVTFESFATASIFLSRREFEFAISLCLHALRAVQDFGFVGIGYFALDS